MTTAYRIRTFFWSITIAFMLISGRLAFLQIKNATHLFKLSQRNFLRYEHIESYRGNITDTHGNVLATNRPVINVYWQGSGNRQLTAHQEESIALLNTILGENSLLALHTPDLAYTERNKRRLLVAADISYEHLSQIMEQLPHNPNVHIVTKAQRFYPQGSLACHTLGYLSTMNAETRGNMGLEKILDEQLRGYKGTKLATINSRGSTIQEKELAPPVHGATIRTTLDLTIQQLIESVFPEQYTGCFIVMEPTTGAIRGILSRPYFDPNLFLHRISSGDWQRIQERQPFINRALTSCFPPASVFKLVTMAAALEENIITQDSTIFCGGSTLYGNRHFHCHRRIGHGKLTVKQALAQSCNILFFEIARRMPIDTLAEYAHRFGLGIKTNFLLPESMGLIPTTTWKRTVKKEPWWPGETLPVAIGQGPLLIPPIQIIRMIASIFTGYLVKPRILEDEPVALSPLTISQDTLTFLQQSMKKVVLEGTARKVNINDIEIYAKTGTAQTSNFINNTQESLTPHHAWLVATFWYKGQSLSFMILAEYAGSTRVVLSIAEQFLMRYRALYKNK